MYTYNATFQYLRRSPDNKFLNVETKTTHIPKPFCACKHYLQIEITSNIVQFSFIILHHYNDYYGHIIIENMEDEVVIILS